MLQKANENYFRFSAISIIRIFHGLDWKVFGFAHPVFRNGVCSTHCGQTPFLIHKLNFSLSERLIFSAENSNK